MWTHTNCLWTHAPRGHMLHVDTCNLRVDTCVHRCCSKCKRRRGRSAFRRSSRQSRESVTNLYDIYKFGEPAARRLAQEKLQRWGFNPDRRCLLTDICKHLLIVRPGFEDEVYPSVDYRDTLHGLLVFTFRCLITALQDMKLSTSIRKVLDQRMVEVGSLRSFRSPSTNRSYRVQKSLFTDNNMTGADKTHWVFLLPHVIGYRAECLPERVREAFLTSISRAQLMFIASRGGRSYTKPELHEIFDRGFIEFFGALEFIYHFTHDRTYSKRQRKHQKNPDKFRAPVPFKRQRM